MSSSEDRPPLSDQTLDLLKALQEALEEEEYTRLKNEIAPSLLFENRLDVNRDEDIIVTIYDLYVKALLLEGDYEEVVQLLTSSSGGGGGGKASKQHTKNNPPAYVVEALEPARIYAMYRLERYEASQQAAVKAMDLSKDTALLLQHLQAQSMYHLQDYKGANTIYHNLLETSNSNSNSNSNTTETIQLLNNMAALACAHMVPYGRSTDELASIRSRLNRVLLEDPPADVDGDDTYDYDLAYNVATYDICTAGYSKSTNGTARALLQNATRATQQTAADQQWSADQLAKEVAALEWNLEWSRWLWQGGIGTSSSTTTTTSGGGVDKHLPMATRMIALANQALVRANTPADAVRLLPQPSQRHFTPLQNCLLYYNRAVFYCQAKQYKQCQDTCQEWATCLQVEKRKSTKKTTETLATNTKVKLLLSPIESLFWTSRIAVLEALCLIRNNTEKDITKAAVQRMDDQLALVRAKDQNDEMVQHLILYLQSHRAMILAQPASSLSLDQTVAFLTTELAPALQQEKAVVASLASLYHKMGREEDALALLMKSGQQDQLADFWLAQRRYHEVVDLLQDSSDAVSRAHYIQALSYIDPERAHQEWTKLQPELEFPDDEDVVNGALLELQELPRLKHTTKPRDATAVTAVSSGSSSKKSHEAVLRRRARRREAYIQDLQRKGRVVTQQPDPERWLPKYERSYNRRRRNRQQQQQQQQQHKGAHQGGISERDAQKLDVAARQRGEHAAQQHDASSGKSTAHMAAVSSGAVPRKGGRRKNN